MNKEDKQNLQFRYLLWLYKTAKDEFDRVERKFTQLEIDRLMLKSMQDNLKPSQVSDKAKLDKALKDFMVYIEKKEKDGHNLKFDGKKLKAEYHFLEVKLKAVEDAVTKMFGADGLKQIKALYEEEMRKRILQRDGH